jgi:hypothetical protein
MLKCFRFPEQLDSLDLSTNFIQPVYVFFLTCEHVQEDGASFCEYF